MQRSLELLILLLLNGQTFSYIKDPLKLSITTHFKSKPEISSEELTSKGDNKEKPKLEAERVQVNVLL